MDGEGWASDWPGAVSKYVERCFGVAGNDSNAVHHRCITGAAFGGVPRNRRPTRNHGLSQKRQPEAGWDEESGLQVC